MPKDIIADLFTPNQIEQHAALTVAKEQEKQQKLKEPKKSGTPKTTAKEIADYWRDKIDESSLSVDWCDSLTHCWRCGYKTKLQRAHIVPAGLKGSDTPNNLVLLCGRCHRDAPNIGNPEYMWIWIKAHKTTFYNTMWTIAGMAEFEKLFGYPPFANTTGITPEEMTKEISSAIENTIIHFGEGKLNVATIACVLKEVELAFTKKKKQ